MTPAPIARVYAGQCAMSGFIAAFATGLAIAAPERDLGMVALEVRPGSRGRS
ncbi:MAG: hypothetical protein GXY82_10400 [Methanospirillum sp.]|nr:hypothetical protein [Methanospirillum sp.]